MKLGFVMCAAFLFAAPLFSQQVMHLAIMVDDGPSKNTLKLLEILREENVKINFDLVGEAVNAHPELAQAIAKDSHSILNHSLSHQHPSQIDNAALEKDIVGGSEAIEKATGTAPRFYWPPFIEIDNRVKTLAEKHGMRLCQTSNMPKIDDWMDTVSAEQIYQNVIGGARDGSLVLFHEWRDETIRTLPAIIRELKKRGAVFISYEEMEKYRAANPTAAK